jgi:hypothetical protein
VFAYLKRLFDRGRGRRELPTELPIDRATERRVAITLSCRDCDQIPKVRNAGEVFRHDGVEVQRMHEGTLVRAGGYGGPWMTRVIAGLRGHHEPQEEVVFHRLVQACRPGTRIVELAAYWAYYTNWYLGAVPNAEAVCVEPDADHVAVGQGNLALNGRRATWIRASLGGAHAASMPFRQSSDGTTVDIPCHAMDSLFDEIGWQPIEMLHLDGQGVELPFLKSLDRAVERTLLRFVVVSTHHGSISGSPTTHADCLRQLESLGAVILCEHGVEESFSGDGLIAASFDPADASLLIPPISRNTPEGSLFGADQP